MPNGSFSLGIDPGLDGGIAVVDGFGCLVFVAPMPTVGESKRTLDLARVFRVIDLWAPAIVVLEAQQAFPRQGSVSGFKTGLGFGQLEGLVFAIGARYLIVRPKEWQKAMGVRGPDTKAAAAVAARGLWPAQDWRESPRCKRAHDGMIDAALMAAFGGRVLKS